MSEVVEFAPGDIVRLKSGSQRMTVIKMEGTASVTVMWSDYNDHKVQTHIIPVIALVKA